MHTNIRHENTDNIGDRGVCACVCIHTYPLLLADMVEVEHAEEMFLVL